MWDPLGISFFPDSTSCSERVLQAYPESAIIAKVEGPYTLLLWNWVPKDHPHYGFLGPNSIIVVYMDPLGKVGRQL